MAASVAGLDPRSAAEKAVSVIGYGFDLCTDIRFSACKSDPSGSRLIELDPKKTRDLLFPGGVVVPNVSTSIKCDKGERTRFSSDVLEFNQMSELFNQELSLSGKIPCGLFTSMFAMTNHWQKEASSTKSLAFDGWFMTLYNVELDRINVTLSETVKRQVPPSWDPLALAEFIENYGTHIIVGVKMGGKDVVHLKQSKKSDHQPAEVQKLLKQLADERFSEESPKGSNVNYTEIPGKLKDDYADPRGVPQAFNTAGMPQIRSHSKTDDLKSISVRRGGIDTGQSFSHWLSTIPQSPNVISMAFVPINALLGPVLGKGFLTHAVNLYLRCEQTSLYGDFVLYMDGNSHLIYGFRYYALSGYRVQLVVYLADKPPIEELHHFLEFQLPRQWAPVYGDLPLGYGPRHRRNMSPSLQFTFMGPKLYVNTTKVDSGNRPVTGIRLYLEGKRGDHLAVHLQHLSDLPGIVKISDDHDYGPADEPVDQAYYEAVKWSMFSHVCTAPCTAPVQRHYSSQMDESAAMVTKAWLEVKTVGMKKVLFLRLGFSTVASAIMRRSEWDGSSTSSRKSGFFSALISTRLSKELNNQPEKPAKVDINSAVYNGGPPVPTRTPKMLNFVDTKEMVRGPEDTPGYWVVTGARLCVESGRISIRAKYSLLTIMSEESLVLM